MLHDERQTRHVDRDGVTVISTGSVRTGVWLLLLALALVGVMFVVVVAPSITQQPSVAVPQDAARGAASASRTGAKVPPAPGPREAGGGERPQLPPVEQRRAAAGDESEAPPADDAENPPSDAEGEEPSGIALFPPPGTDPIKAGIVVPDDFELPAGFVRHHQTTDNGKPLPPILMFHPDYQPVDEKGEKIALPADRVVPAEMAPAGLPHQMLDVPDDSVPMVEGANDRPNED